METLVKRYTHHDGVFFPGPGVEFYIPKGYAVGHLWLYVAIMKEVSENRMW